MSSTQRRGPVSAPRYWAVIPSAGTGARKALGRPRQYLPVRGRALLEWALAPFLDAGWIDGVVVVLPRGDNEFARLPIARHPKILTIAGGVARVDSVLAGLGVVSQAAAGLSAPLFVLVHDDARPCLTVDDLERLRDEADDDNGGLLAVPLNDVLKRESHQRAVASVDRGGLWRAQSPQLFRLDRLRAVLEQARAQGLKPEDEASAMEGAGYKPLLVRGRESNLRVTAPEDLPLAEFWLSRQDYAR